jgi:mannan endo-1,4-beta-mannosidase
MPQSSALSTTGRFLLDPQGLRILLRGINLQTWDDPNFPQTNGTGAVAWASANAVRLQWYKDYTKSGSRTGPVPISDLDGLLQNCEQQGLIPIVMLADWTTSSDVSQINSDLVPWWTDPANMDVLQKYEERLIINIGNEVGIYRWADDPASSLNDYLNAYKQAIAALRAAGYQLPLMIDAPDGGSSIDAFLQVGQQLIEADPLHNLLLSVHAYWAAYDGMSFVEQTIAANLPIVFGEIANWQDGTDTACVYSLDGSGQGTPAENGYTYQSLLTLCQQNLMGWLAWSWGPDDCPPRNISINGVYPAQFTPYGNDLVNNLVYGLNEAAPAYGRWGAAAG